MQNHLAEFADGLRNAPNDPSAERIVRLTIEEVAKNCPMPILMHIGQCVIDCRRDELRQEAELN